MTLFQLRLTLATCALALAAGLPHPATAEEAQAPPFSSDPAVSAQQHQVYDVVHRYELMLNAGNTDEILKLFAPDSVAEWNNKTTFKTRQQKADAYSTLFKVAKFTTVFGYDAMDVYGDMAIVRTYHHKGATVFENGKDVPDFNREIFVLRKVAGEWKIILYAFNTNPDQGEG